MHLNRKYVSYILLGTLFFYGLNEKGWAVGDDNAPDHRQIGARPAIQEGLQFLADYTEALARISRLSAQEYTEEDVKMVSLYSKIKPQLQELKAFFDDIPSALRRKMKDLLDTVEKTFNFSREAHQEMLGIINHPEFFPAHYYQERGERVEALRRSVDQLFNLSTVLDVNKIQCARFEISLNENELEADTATAPKDPRADIKSYFQRLKWGQTGKNENDFSNIFFQIDKHDNEFRALTEQFNTSHDLNDMRRKIEVGRIRNELASYKTDLITYYRWEFREIRERLLLCAKDIRGLISVEDMEEMLGGIGELRSPLPQQPAQQTSPAPMEIEPQPSSADEEGPAFKMNVLSKVRRVLQRVFNNLYPSGEEGVVAGETSENPVNIDVTQAQQVVPPHALRVNGQPTASSLQSKHAPTSTSLKPGSKPGRTGPNQLVGDQRDGQMNKRRNPSTLNSGKRPRIKSDSEYTESE